MLLGNTTVNIIRRAPGTNDRTGYTPGAETTTSSAAASVQPITGEDVNLLPERLQASAQWKMYLPQAVDIRVAFDAAGNITDDALPDLIEYEGVRYRVYASNKYRHFLIRHSRYFLILPESYEERPDGLT